jgi:hypothetical protein
MRAYSADESLVADMISYLTAKCMTHGTRTQAVYMAITDVVADIKRAHYSNNTRRGLIAVDYKGLKNNADKEILS